MSSKNFFLSGLVTKLENLFVFGKNLLNISSNWLFQKKLLNDLTSVQTLKVCFKGLLTWKRFGFLYCSVVFSIVKCYFFPLSNVAFPSSYVGFLLSNVSFQVSNVSFSSSNVLCWFSIVQCPCSTVQCQVSVV